MCGGHGCITSKVTQTCVDAGASSCPGEFSLTGSGGTTVNGTPAGKPVGFPAVTLGSLAGNDTVDYLNYGNTGVIIPVLFETIT